MANLKNITELPLAESAEGLNLIVNDSGFAKQIAASAVGAQADFNVTDENSPAYIKNKPSVVQADWAETDENNPAFVKNKPGVAQPDWNENDESKAAFIKNKTHWKEEETIFKWDGNIEGLETATLIRQEAATTEIILKQNFYKVSDDIPNDSDIIGATMKVANWEALGPPPSFPSESIIASDQDSGMIILDDGSTLLGEPLQNCKMIISAVGPLVLIAEDSISYSDQPDDNIIVNINIPSKGVYVWHFSSEEFFPPEEVPPVSIYCTSIINRKYYTLDENYLPDEIKAGRVYPESYHGEIFNDYVDNEASGDYSHAEGYGTIARGNYSHAEGQHTTATGVGAHAEGRWATASGNYSHAEGESTIASGVYSHAEGYETSARSSYQHAQGKYNVEDFGRKYAHIVGNGTADNARSNAHTLDWNGNAWYAGTVKCAGIILTSPNGTEYQITIADDGTLSANAIPMPS